MTQEQSHELGGYIPVDEDDDPRGKALWLSIPVFALSLIVPAVVLVACRQELIAGAMLATLNCIVVAAAAVYLHKQGTIRAFVPMLFLGFFTISWPIPTLYFAIFAPDYGYSPDGDTIYPYMSGIVQMQLTVLVFITVFLAIVIPMVKRRRGEVSFHAALDPVLAGRLAVLSLVIGCVAVVANMISKVITLPTALTYVCNGVFNYLYGIFLVAGAFYRYISRGVLLFTFLFLGCAAFFYIAGNARMLAFYPIFSFVVGMLFFSDMPQRKKGIMLIAIVTVFPIVLVAANTTREVLGSIGFTDMGRRVEVLGQWQDVLAKGSTGIKTMDRLFIQGSHAVVTMTPDSCSYEDFSPSTFIQALAMKMFVPGILQDDKGDYLTYAYTYQEFMPKYGFLITDETSVPMGIIGFFWIFGGYMPLVIGALATGLIVGGFAILIGRMERKSVLMAIFVMTMVANTMFEGPKMDIISFIRGLCWKTVLGIVVYMVIMSVFVGGASKEHELSQTPTN